MAVRGGKVAPAHVVSGGICAVKAVNERRRSAQRDKAVHIRRAAYQIFEAVAEIVKIQRDYRHGQQKLSQRKDHHVLVAFEYRGQRESRHVTHADVKQRH